MPMHDWTKVPAGLFHHFHQHWTIELASALNRGRLPEGVDAIVERRSGPLEPDVVVSGTQLPPQPNELIGGMTTRERPAAQIIRRNDRFFYSEKANRVVIRQQLGEVVAVIEILSPGVKDGLAIHRFVENMVAFLREGVHVLIVDLFPPTLRDPYGIHKLIWDGFLEEDFTFPARQGSHCGVLRIRPGNVGLHRTSDGRRPLAGYAAVPGGSESMCRRRWS